jgi:hypothetical protein
MQNTNLPHSRAASRASARAAHQTLIETNPQSLLSLASLERQVANKPIFTRRMLEQAAKNVEQARKNQKTIQINGIYPNVRAKIWPVPGAGPAFGVDIDFQKRFTMADDGQEALPYILHVIDGQRFDADSIVCTNTITPNSSNALRRRAQKESPDPNKMDYLKKMEHKWAATSQWASIKKKLVTMASEVEIKNIVCIGLGKMPIFRDQAVCSGNGIAHQHVCTHPPRAVYRTPPG